MLLSDNTKGVCTNGNYWSNNYCKHNRESVYMTLTELAEKYGESIDNLPMDILMEGIYNERNAYVAGVLHDNESEEKKT